MDFEAYRVAASLVMKVNEVLGPLAEVIKVQRDVLAGQRAINDAMQGMYKGLRDSATAAKSLADQMERVQRASAAVSTAAAAAASQVQRAAQAAAAAPTPSTALVPAPRLLPPPQRGFSTLGDPYGPDTQLVPIGSPATRSEATGRRPADNTALAPYAQPGVPGYAGFTIPPGGGAPPDAPFFEPGKEPRVPLYPRASRGDWYAVGYGAQTMGDAAGGLVDGSFMAAAGADQLKMALKAQKFTPEQIDAAYAAAVKTQQEVLGTYVGKNLGLIVQLMALTQDANISIGLLPEMARAQQVFAGLGRDGNAEITAAMQSAELRGVLFKKDGDKEVPDLGATRQFLQNMEAVTAMSGGRYGPRDILQLLKSGGISAGIMSDENGFAEMMPFIQSMGPARAGTAMRAFGREFPGGRMSDAAFNTLVDMGVITHPELAQKSGIAYHQLLPGAISQGDFDQASNHQQKFILETLLPRAQAYDAKYYGKAYTDADDKKKMAIDSVTMGQIASMIPGGVYMSEMLRLAPLASRDAAAFKRQRGGDAYDDVVAKNPLMVLEGYKAAVNALMVTLGSDNMKLSIATMRALTGGINLMSDAFAKDKNLGGELMAVATALAVLGPVVRSMAIIIPAIDAAKRILPAVASGSGAGGLLGKILGPLGLGLTGYNMLQQDLHNDQYGLFNPQSYKNNAAGLADAASDLFHGRFHDAFFGRSAVINLNVDGKTLTSVVLKDIHHAANGPDTGTGTFDSGRSYQQTTH